MNYTPRPTYRQSNSILSILDTLLQELVQLVLELVLELVLVSELLELVLELMWVLLKEGPPWRCPKAQPA